MHKRILARLFVAAVLLAFTGPQRYTVHLPLVYWPAASKLACQGQILCTVYEDTNGNGWREPNEVGMSGIRLALQHLDKSNEVSVITDRSGHVSVAVRPGRYAVRLEAPSGYRATTPHVWGVDIMCATAQLNFGLEEVTTHE